MADEIIVVDTGSIDQSREIAVRFGARVFDFPWTDDFAAARNFSLEQATGTWILVLDADETISSRNYPALKKITNETPTTPTAYYLLTRNYTNRHDLVGLHNNSGDFADEEKGCGWLPSIKVRLWSNHPQIRFFYPVHERVEPALQKLGIEAQPAPIVIHHYGKLNEQQARAKGEKYFQIGLQKLQQMDDNAREPIRELAIQAGILGRHQEAETLWQRYLKLDPDNAEAYLNLGTAQFAAGKLAAALNAARTALQLKPGLKEAAFNLALYLLHSGKAQETTQILEKLLQNNPGYQAAHFLYAAASCCLQNSDNNKFQTDPFETIRTDILTPKTLQVAASELVNTLFETGQKSYANAIKKAVSD